MFIFSDTNLSIVSQIKPPSHKQYGPCFACPHQLSVVMSSLSVGLVLTQCFSDLTHKTESMPLCRAYVMFILSLIYFKFEV